MRCFRRLPTALVLAGLAASIGAAPGPAPLPQAPGTGPNRPPVVEPTDPATRLAAWRQHERMEAESPFAGLKWRAVGPRMQGGRIESIAVAPGSDSTIYVGVGSGNLWKTTNNGITWRPVFDKESAFAIGDVTIAPSDPDTVWVGTGEVLMARSSYAGTGVFKSTDGGETWNNMGLTDSHHVARVLIHPEDPDTVWVAAIGHLYSDNPERGVFRTTDGGITWQRVLYVDERTGAIELVMDPSDPDTLYAAMWERSRKAWGHTTHGPGSGVYKSTDGGTNWQRLGDGMDSGSGLPVGADIGRIGLAVARSNPAVVYALVDNYAPDPSPSPAGGGGPGRIGGEIYRSDDRGASWRKVNQAAVPVGYDFCLIQVAPDDENVVYLPNNRFWVSEDGGRTTRQIEGTLVHLLPHGSRVLHLDMHDLWIDPDNGDHMLLGNDGGLHLSYDRGASWLHLNNLPIGEFYAVSVDMDTPYNIYGGTQDDAALFGASDQVIEDDVGDRWTHVYLDRWGGGDSYFTYRDKLDADLVYYEHQFGELRRKRMSTGETVRIRPEAADGEPELRRNWMTPFFISDHNPLTLYYGANVLYKSLDRGDTWWPISPDLTSRPATQGNVPWGTLTTVAESPLRPGLLYTGADDGTVHVTRDDGATWERIDEGLPDRWVTRLVASRHDEATVYASLTGYRYDEFTTYVFASDDHGATWRSIVGNLPGEPVNVIAEDPVRADILYVGTDTGVYVSIDRGGTWHALCADLPTTPVYDLVVHPRDGELVIATHGRSIFVLDVAPIRELASGQGFTSVPLEETAVTSANASLGDLDGDGDLDIVLAKGRHWPLVDFVLLNDGTGGFTQRHELGGSADRTYTAALADLDGDGDLDLVVGNDRPDDKRVYFNDGDGHFRLVGTFGDPQWPTRNVTVADVNGDRRPEIIVANRGGPDNLSANYICVNDGAGAFPSCDVLSRESATTIAAGDLTGDGLVDLFVPHRDGGQSYLFVNDGDGGFAQRVAVGPARSATRAVALGDLDGNGLLDIVVGDQMEGGAWLYINRGGATFAPPRAIGDRADDVYALAVADLDGDGDADIVVGNRGAPGAVLRNDGSGESFSLRRFGDERGAVYGLAIGDVNGDGAIDIVAGRSDAPNTLYLGRQ